MSGAISRNRFDNLEVDVDKVYREWPINGMIGGESSWYRIYSVPYLPLKWRHCTWHVLRRSQLDQSWFERFRPYWIDVLGGRPLAGIQDLYWLRNWYRVKFQRSQVDDGGGANEHLRAWQSPEILYQLLDRVYKESLVSESPQVELMGKYARGRVESMLEFGCATAPVATSLVEFDGIGASTKIYIADIKTLAFHYGAYKFGQEKRVRPVLLEARNNFHLQLNEKLDVIFCITVFEHLPDPMQTVRIFYDRLQKGGLLIFDYVKSGGGGLDTRKAQEERYNVLDFIGEHFAVVHGSLNKSASMPVTVARKRC